MQAVILAGGLGTRLKPFTNVIPKPLVPLGDMPILEIVLRQLKKNGFDEVILTVNHLSELIRAFFGDGEKVGMKIRYSREDSPLGTAGPLKLIDGLEENFLVMNGDLLTTIRYADLIGKHVQGGNSMTIGTFEKEVKIDLGVLETKDGEFLRYVEKPTYHYTVSMGVYALNKRILEYIPEGQRHDMPTLVEELDANGEKIMCYSGDYEWLDIGRIEDYENAVELFQENRAKYL